MYLVEKHRIKSTNKHFGKLVELSKLSNNLYNQALYWLQYSLENFGEWYSYEDLDKFMKRYVRVMTPEYDNYSQLPASVAQQTLRLLSQNVKSYVKAIKDWKINPQKYRGMPEFPRFRKKGGQNSLLFTSQSARLKSGVIHFPVKVGGLTIRLRNSSVETIKQVRIIPKGLYFIVEVVYEVLDIPVEDSGGVAGIDLGLNNLASLVFGDFSQPVLFNGRPLKAINKYFNVKVAKYKSILDKTQKDQKSSRRLKYLYQKRNNIMDNYLHQISRLIVNLLVEKGITTLVVGKNTYQKQENQLTNFVQVPVFRLLNYLKYKCKRAGIKCIETEESYTTGTSYLDSEQPIKGLYNITRRVSRGVFLTNTGQRINADVNSGYQILKKVGINVQYKGHKTIFNPVTITL